MRSTTLIIALSISLFLAVLWVPATGSGEAPARALSLDEIRTVLESQPEDLTPVDEEIAFFESRLARTPGDPVALRRTAAARLQRHRLSGDDADLDAAARGIEALLAREPDDARALDLRASLRLARHDFAGSLADARRARQHAPAGEMHPELRLFDALWASGAYEEARQLLESVRPERPSAALLARKARLLDGLGDIEAARDTMAEAVDLMMAYAEPRIVQGWGLVELGHFTFHAGDPDAAVDRYLEALERVPGYAAAMEGLASVAYGVDGDLALAETLYERAFSQGGHLDILAVLADVAEARGRSGDADQLRGKILRDAGWPREVREDALRLVASTLTADGEDPERALTLAERDLERRQDRGAWITRARALSRLGRHYEAMEDVDQGLAWGAVPPVLLYQAGLVARAAGDKDKSRDLLEAALEGSAELGPLTSEHIRAELSTL